jgi:hypothetical protein
LRQGLPHSEISGSKVARTSPKLFAACHVLHRLSAPRHPPNALHSLATLQTKRHKKTMPGSAARHRPQASAWNAKTYPCQKQRRSPRLARPSREPDKPPPDRIDQPDGTIGARDTRRPTERKANLCSRRPQTEDQAGISRMISATVHVIGSTTRPDSKPTSIHDFKEQRPAPGWPTSIDRPKTQKPGTTDRRSLVSITKNHPNPKPGEWWARADLNGRPHAYQACALTN